MLTDVLFYHHRKRMTVFEALDHPWLTKDVTEDQRRRIPSKRYENVRRQMHERIVSLFIPLIVPPSTPSYIIESSFS